ncbi:MAG: rod shape-determining protein MreC [Rickettsia sp.]|nr:rod shape-determining protein MreC [Rickettsia sp.]
MYKNFSRGVKIFILIFSILFLLSIKFFPYANSFLQKISLNVVGYSLNLVDFICVPVKGFFDKLKQNSDLIAENNALKRELIEQQSFKENSKKLYQENQNLKSILKYKDFSKNFKCNFIVAKIIGGKENLYNHFLILNKGKSDGVKISDLVFADGYVIGKIKNLTSNYSLAKLITDPKNNIPVITEKSKEKAIMSNQNGKILLSYFNKNHKILLNENVMTSNFSQSYLPNLLLGCISNISPSSISVDLYVNFSDISFVTIELLDIEMQTQVKKIS